MITKGEKLRFWCQKVLPLVYDESLSYYELLNKVVKHLNDNTEKINELIDFYNNFSGEIEEILIQLIEDGDLDPIIADTIGSLIAAPYDPTSTYITFDYCIYESKLYRANGTTTGDFDAEKWDEKILCTDITTLLHTVYSLTANSIPFDSLETYDENTVGYAILNLISTSITDVFYDSSAHALRKTINGSSSKIIDIEDTPTNASNKLPSSKAYLKLLNNVDYLSIPLYTDANDANYLIGRLDGNTLNTPTTEGLSSNTAGIILTVRPAVATWNQQLCILNSTANRIYMRTKDASSWTAWKDITAQRKYQGKKLLIVGDSYSNGWDGQQNGDGWVPTFAAVLGCTYDLIRQGGAGVYKTYATSQYPNETYGDAIDHVKDNVYDAVVYQVGTNDIFSSGSVNDILQGVSTLMDKTKLYFPNAEVYAILTLGRLCLSKSADANRAEALVKGFISNGASTCSDALNWFLFISGTKGLNGDKVHLNQTGYTILGKLAATFVEYGKFTYPTEQTNNANGSGDVFTFEEYDENNATIVSDWSNIRGQFFFVNLTVDIVSTASTGSFLVAKNYPIPLIGAIKIPCFNNNTGFINGYADITQDGNIRFYPCGTARNGERINISGLYPTRCNYFEGY